MSTTEYRFGRFRLIPAAHELWRDDELKRVPPLVFDCLAYLLQQRERMVGRDELVSAVWGRLDVADAQIRQLIARARRAVDDDAQAQQVIRTVAGVGYRWVMALDEADVGDGAAKAARESDLTLAASPAPMSEPDAERTAHPPAIAVEGSAATSAAKQPIGWRVALPVALVVLVAAALGFTALRQRGASEPARSRESTSAPSANPEGKAVVVLPLEVSAPDESAWIRLGGMDLVAGRLRTAKLPVPPTDSVVTALHSVGDAQNASGQERLRGILGAAMVVQGSAAKSPAGWHVVLSAISADGVQHRIESDHANVIAALDGASDLLLAALGHAPAGEVGRDDAVRVRLQQAQAAMLAGELGTARAILGDESLARQADAEVRFRLAQADFLEGRFDQADASLNALLERKEVRAQPVLQAQALNLRGLIDFRRRDCAAMERHAGEAVSALPDGQSPADAGQALATRALARICTEHWEDALADLGQARVQMEAAGDRLGVARVDQYHGRLELQRDRPAEAVPYFEAADGVLASFGAVEPLMNNLLSLVDAQSRLLRWKDALATSERLWSMRERMADTNRRAYLGAMRANVLLAVGRDTDVEATLVAMRALTGDAGAGALALCSVEADLALRRGHYGEALAAVARALQNFPDAPGPDDAGRAYLELLRQRASIAAGRPLRADPPARDDGTPQQAAALVAKAEWAAYQHDEAAAGRLLREASAAAEADGVPEIIVMVAEAYVKWLLGQGRAGEAGVQASRVAVWAGQDFDSALLQVRAFHALGRREAWQRALQQARLLAGEREIPAELLRAPDAP
ncbi:winged helix-turn-helix domain-containing protein [Dokdonella sp.]|uniref:winged helix-turn-helix domain-containing protein n=1 Tax=Dokdonella sp. TaxID=2291710 RepID=UPI001B030A6F|nr:winged helix-turn-helix domain-containing protein [Dokdonella sp.]MBO9665020.1 winged helix-turn-helix domain-containing protein [Dokdonella sp.]